MIKIPNEQDTPIKYESSWIERNLVFRPNSLFSKCWSLIIILMSIYTAALYPYITAFRILDPDNPIAYTTLICEAVMFLDMIYRFLLAYQLEGETTYITDLAKISSRYVYSGDFIKDFIIWQPLFYFLSQYSEFYLMGLLIKCARFQ